MKTLREDQLEVESVFRRYEMSRKGKKIAPVSYDSMREDLYAPAVKYAEDLLKENASILARRRSYLQARELFKRYCSVKMGSDGFDCTKLNEAMDRLVEGMSLSVAKVIQNFRKEYPPASDISIMSHITNKKRVESFMSSRPEEYFHPFFGAEAKKRMHITEFSETAKARSNTERSDGLYDTVTAFVDESYRINPWRIYDRSLPKYQTSFSYIICKGALDAEYRITDENTLEKNACLARWSEGNTYATIEAIHTVLEILALKYGFHGNVRIYTDNMCTVKKWDDSDYGAGLGALFNSVTVAFIPRTENKKADSIGRGRIFADISKETMKKVEIAMHGENVEEDTLDYVESFFPEPDRDLPKLVSDLENLSTAIGCYPASEEDENERSTSGNRIRTLLSSIRQGILVGYA